MAPKASAVNRLKWRRDSENRRSASFRYRAKKNTGMMVLTRTVKTNNGRVHQRPVARMVRAAFPMASDTARTVEIQAARAVFLMFMNQEWTIARRRDQEVARRRGRPPHFAAGARN